ncbi:aminotransferase class I/II-fold pyridoxal phosphate-dependent enzyme [Patescibacteria group bacterium]|nr:aminotransferase class I/II-fold pyridoxal phosphate-dependent enzyme [Patescibacteria group bacterium]MCL5091946.1 aminotransferase class I/II-fold pyridoxal phosphate-dependent enzyme [Patescibacteria group bacterium]
MKKTGIINSKPFDPLDSRPLNTPIFQTSSFFFDDFKQMEDVFTLNQKNFVYTRGGNPTVNVLEHKIAKLENGADAVCFSSGIAAISTTLFSLVKTGDTLVASDVLYGSSMSFIKNVLTRYGIKVVITDLSDIDKLQSVLKVDKNVKAIFFETPCNPTLKLIDIKKIAAIAYKYRVKTVVDNTLASTYFQKPLDFGSDIVVHSLTKYYNGHGTALGGAAISKDADYITMLKFSFMCEIGSCMDPMSAFLILNGLKTYEIRMKQHEQNALKIARFLEKNRKVKKVIYPGLKSYPYKTLLKKQMRGYGSIVSFYLNTNSIRQIEQFISRLQTFTLAVSFGETRSLVSYPLKMSHREYLNEKNSSTFKTLSFLIRLSIGLENPHILIEDLKNSLVLVK